MRKDVFKKSLLNLLDDYLKKSINEELFCDRFYLLYSRGIEKDLFDIKELEILNKLDFVVSRFSSFPEDHALDDKAFTTVNQLKHTTNESRDKLLMIW